MPTPLLETLVRADWREIEVHRATRSARLWRYVQAASVALALATLALTLIPALAPRQDQLRILLTAVFLWPLPLWSLAGGDRRRFTAGIAATLAAAAIVALSAPSDLAARGWQGTGPLPALLALPAVLLVWAWIIRAANASPDVAHRLGVRRRGWAGALALGAAAGAALGLHLWLVAGAVSGWPQPGWGSAPALIWFACALAAVRSPAEELLYRGLGYRSLADMGQADWPRVAFRLALVNLFVYVAPMASVHARPGLWVLTLVYAAVLAVANAGLRIRTGRTLPCIASNLVFGLFMAGAGAL